jgi:hypothetical protein
MIVGATMSAPYALRQAAVCALAALAVMSLTCPTLAQTRPVEVFGGYSYLNDPSHSVLTATARDNAMPLGWAAGVALPVWRAVSIAADLSGHYKHQTTFVDDITLTYHTVAAGPRASARIGPFVEFGEILAGVGIAHGSAFGVSANTTALLLQGGGGLDYPVASRIALRAQLDYRRLTGSDDGRLPANQLRVVAAIVVR